MMAQLKGKTMKNAFFEDLIYINDVCFISKKLKNFNRDFRLCYSKKLEKYVVFNEKDRKIEITFNSYPNGDILQKLISTSFQNQEKLIEMIDENNKRIYSENENNQRLKSQCQLESVLNYQNSKPSFSLSQQQIKNIIGEYND